MAPLAQTVNQLYFSAFGLCCTQEQMQPGQERAPWGEQGAWCQNGMSGRVLSLCPRTAASSLWQPWCLTPADLTGDVDKEAASPSGVPGAQGNHALELAHVGYSRSVASSQALEQRNEVPYPEALSPSLGSLGCLFPAQK